MRFKWSRIVNSTADQLFSQLKKVVEDLEGLATTASGSGAEYGAAVAERLREALTSARDRIHELEQNLQRSAARGAKVADSYVHENPWTSIAVAAAIAFLVGALSRRHD